MDECLFSRGAGKRAPSRSAKGALRTTPLLRRKAATELDRKRLWSWIATRRSNPPRQKIRTLVLEMPSRRKRAWIMRPRRRAQSAPRTTTIRHRRTRFLQNLEESDRPFKFEFAYLKLLPREYDGPPHIVKVGQRADGRDEYEERPGEPPPYQSRINDENVMTTYFVRAQNTANEIACATD